MAFTTTTTAAASLTLSRGDKITSNAGQARDLYVIEVGPTAQGMKRRARILAPVTVSYEAFSEVDSTTLAPEYATAAMVLAQVKTEKAGRWNAGQGYGTNMGPLAPESREVLYFNNADSTQDFGLIRIVVADAAEGLMFSGLFTVELIPPPTVTSAGDPDLGTPAVTTAGTPVALSPMLVELQEQFMPVGNSREKRGDAKIIIPRTTSEAALTAEGALIRITPRGGSAQNYQLWGSEGLVTAQTYHWCVYLKRLRP